MSNDFLEFAEQVGTDIKPLRASTDIRRLDGLVELGEGWNPGMRVELIRRGYMVSIAAQSIGRAEASTGNNTILTLPNGYRPPIDQYFTTWRGVRARIITTGVLQLNSAGTALDYLTLTFPVTSAFPSPPYPGTAG